MSELDWDAIRAQHPIASIVGHAIKLEKSGREYKGLCPFHAEKTPSFHVVPDKEFFHCFGCGAHGDVIDFISAYQNISTIEAVGMLTGGDTGNGAPDPEIKAKRQALLDKRDADHAARRASATREAARIWEAASPADQHHPYLVRKSVPAHTCRQTPQGALLLPVYDAAGDIQSVQTIDDNGGKLFQPGAPMGLGRMMIGINMGRTILCEGYATGASIYDALSDQVCVTFSLGNMEKVAREKHAAGQSIVLASDSGLVADKMARLGAELNCPVVYPAADIVDSKTGEVGNDFNDQAAAYGSDSVAATFRNALRSFAERATRVEEASKADSGPVDLWRTPPPPQLPQGLLPPLIERFAYDRSEQLGTDPAGLAMSALVACASVIRDEIAIKPKRHEKWTESARLWVMLVGKPSTKKSPIMRAAAGRIKSIDTHMLYEGNRALAAWQDDGGTKGSTAKPLTPRLRIEDITMEAAQEVCKDSPDGIMVLQDELSGWFGGIEKYAGAKGSSKDRSFWLQAYGGGQYAVNRIGRGSFLIDNLSVSILGGIQPDTIRRIMDDATDDGLIQRFMPIILGKAKQDRDIEIPPVAEEFDSLIDKLHELRAPRNFFGKQPVTFSEEAMAVRESMATRNFRLVHSVENFNPKMSSHIGKFDGLLPRLCLIWHCIEHVGADVLPVEISAATAARVSEFVTGFIMRHSMAFYSSTIGLSDNQEKMRAVAGYILSHRLETVTMRTIDRGVRAVRGVKFREDRERIFEHLESFGWLLPVARRSDAPSWNVNPQVHLIFEQQAELERQQRADVLEAIHEIEGEYER